MPVRSIDWHASDASWMLILDVWRKHQGLFEWINTSNLACVSGLDEACNVDRCRSYGKWIVYSSSLLMIPRSSMLSPRHTFANLRLIIFCYDTSSAPLSGKCMSGCFKRSTALRAPLSNPLLKYSRIVLSIVAQA